jgi:hypothetical protein
MRIDLRLPSFVLLFAAAACTQAAATALPGFIAGHWCAADGHGEEYWLPAKGGLMLGVSRTAAPGERTTFEFLRIAIVDGVPAYLAMPEGRAATVFKQTAGGDDWVRFENPAHDFPRRIEYRRDGDALHAEIAGPGDGGAEQVIGFDFRRCAP